MRESREITVFIRCHDLPKAGANEAATRLGIQRGDEVVDDVPVQGDSVTFQAALRVSSRKNGEVNFLGPFAHGRPEERFLYLCWGKRPAAQWQLSGRVKVPLIHWDWERLDQAWASETPLTLSVAMTDNKGRPVCGSVKVDLSETKA